MRVLVTLKPSLLDSAGRTVADSLNRLGFSDVQSARIGKLIELEVENPSKERISEMCQKLLANPVTENYDIEVLG